MNSFGLVLGTNAVSDRPTMVMALIIVPIKTAFLRPIRLTVLAWMKVDRTAESSKVTIHNEISKVDIYFFH